MEGDKVLAKALESEFLEALAEVTSPAELTQSIEKLLGLMGYREFSVFHCTAAGYYLKKPPKILINNNSTQPVHQAIRYFYSVSAMRPSQELLDIYYEETNSLFDSPNTSVRRGCCILGTPATNYGYVFRKGSQASSGQQVLSVVDKTCSSNQFTVQTKNNRLALDALNKSIQEVGLKRFPQHFSDSASKESITATNTQLCLLNIIAHNDVTLSQAARIMGMSVDTANKKIAKIKSDFGVSTLPSAVLYATNKDLIDRVL